MKFWAGDHYEYILVGIIFGLVGISILLMFFVLLLPQQMVQPIYVPQYWKIAGKCLKVIWVIISIIFWFSIIKKGKKIMKIKGNE